MGKYRITVRKVWRTTMYVDAQSKEEAKEIYEDMCEDGTWHMEEIHQRGVEDDEEVTITEVPDNMPRW